MRKIVIIGMGTIFVMTAAGCETAKGFKKDVQMSGEYAKQLPGQTKQFLVKAGHSILKADEWFKENAW